MWIVALLACAPPCEPAPAWHPPELVEGLSDAWLYPAWVASEAQRCGDRLVQEGIDGSEVSGRWVDGAPDGPWTATWAGGREAMEGTYAAGEPVGEWIFVAVDGAIVAQGSLLDGQPHGPWTVPTESGTAECRFVHGILHGAWEETRTDGTVVRGHYFNGAKNYEWEVLAPGEADELVLVGQEAWKYGTFVARWDPRTEPCPLPDRQLPATLGPNGEGLPRVHATCATNALLTVSLTGAGLDDPRSVPVLVDVAEGDFQEPERTVLVDGYHIDDVALIDPTHARARVRVDARCAVIGGQVLPDEPREVVVDWVWEDAIWKLAAALEERYVRVDVWMDHVAATDPDLAAATAAGCQVTTAAPPG